ncbi:MAG TPA: UDP-N-acetylmuramate:L-alanyl-gamma-D-glutamyl-meso-diaminopimelate ligase [Thiothrix sp.]|nr:UDP-N-acetylmuramate:L-alanyl-gamma-D-glutamyl-meso-diaminopimelate ligase [Thiothrix sp.]
MKIHILGICGTFMGGIALLAREAGIEVTGSDANVYPPMSTQLEAQGIALCKGYSPHHISDDCDSIVVGNVMKRGLPVVEHVLNHQQPYTSGPQWLFENVLQDRWVLAVAGTHGKTTTASMLAWILEYAGLKPGFLIGGVPENFGVSARLGESPFFVVEADEYDTAFFDKRSKFVHYHPRTVILNNLEYDHADIFPNIQAIQTQFHHLLRMIPSEGLVISNQQAPHLDEVLDMGCWTPIEHFDGQATTTKSESDRKTAKQTWQVHYLKADGSAFEVFFAGELQGIVRWDLLGEHNVSNALAAIAAARHAGVPTAHAIDALAQFKGVKRRMQLRGTVNQIRVYDDFAHHPTAIATTLKGLRANVGQAKIIAILEPRSNTMRMGIHKANIAPALALADEVILYQPEGLDWDMQDVVNALGENGYLFQHIDAIIQYVLDHASAGDHILIMSNGGFAGIHDKLLAALANHLS